MRLGPPRSDEISMASNIGLVLLIVLAVAVQAYATVTCSLVGSGRHADTSDSTCRNYTLCVYDSSTSAYLSYDYVCPTTSVFDPNTAQCTASSDYDCSG